jgi:hypothetical protein
MSTPDRPAKKVLSCSSCRSRKIKCSKAQPQCVECSRAGIQCTYPSRRPTRRAPRPRQKELLDRISRLEDIVGQVEKSQADIDPTAAAAAASAARPDATALPEPTARYLSSDFWGNLSAEVEAIRQALEQTSSDNEDDDGPPNDAASLSNPSSAGTPSGYILGNPDYHERQLPHPPPSVMMRLWDLYCRNCDPIIKILHQPTMTEEIQAIARSEHPQAIAPALNALVFCIYFGAITSIRPESCEKEFGEPLGVLSQRYRVLAEQALAAADYLNSNDLRTLQAFAIYICMIRSHSHGRTSWSLTALFVRLAHAMNLHRDGDGRRFTPFEAEMRRRLWGWVLILDIRTSEDRGTDNIVLANTYDTSTPTLIDDADFSPASPGPLKPKDTPTENIVTNCMIACSSLFGSMVHQPHKMDDNPNQASYTEDDLMERVRHLEASFIHNADHTHLPSLYASEIARIVILKLWLACQYPFSAQSAVPRTKVSRETMLRTALSVMELQEKMQLPPWRDRFSWWTVSYVQWHPLAVTLAELCIRTEGDLVDRAWEVVDRVYPLCRDVIADTHRGTLWRPIKKLMSRAKAARAATALERCNLNVAAQPAAEARPKLPPPQDMGFTILGTDSVIRPLPQSTMQMDVDPAMADTSMLPIPQNLANLYFDEPGFTAQDMDLTLWNEFLMDTQVDHSPSGSGTSG